MDDKAALLGYVNRLGRQNLDLLTRLEAALLLNRDMCGIAVEMVRSLQNDIRQKLEAKNSSCNGQSHGEYPPF